MLRKIKKWVLTHVMTTYVIVFVVLQSINVVFFITPAYNDCRATGETAGKCAVSLQYWVQKRFWNY